MVWWHLEYGSRSLMLIMVLYCVRLIPPTTLIAKHFPSTIDHHHSRVVAFCCTVPRSTLPSRTRPLTCTTSAATSTSTALTTSASLRVPCLCPCFPSFLALFLIARLGALRREMIGIATVVTLRDNNSIIHMLSREIPLLTKLQVIIYCPCSTRGLLDFKQDITTRHQSQGRPARCIQICILNGFIHKNHLELWHRAISKPFHILCKGLGAQET